MSDLELVHWAGGIWRVVDRPVPRESQWELPPQDMRVLIRWVYGPRPSKGIFHWTEAETLAPLSPLEVIALAATDEAWLYGA